MAVPSILKKVPHFFFRPFVLHSLITSCRAFRCFYSEDIYFLLLLLFIFIFRQDRFLRQNEYKFGSVGILHCSVGKYMSHCKAVISY